MAEITEHLSTALADRYRIERPLGEGGMATVYLAEDLKHDRKVALTVLRPELAAVLGADRFVQEIKTTAQLQHPHILPCAVPDQLWHAHGRALGQHGAHPHGAAGACSGRDQAPGFLISDEGTAYYLPGHPVFAPGPVPNAVAVWVNRTGHVEPVDSSWQGDAYARGGAELLRRAAGEAEEVMSGG